MTLLRKRGLLPLLAAQIVSSLGSQMTFLTLPWFVLVTTGSPTKMGIVLAAELAPIALLGIPSGALVARLGARRTMLVGDAARVPLMASLPLLHAADVLSFPLLLGIVFAIGCFLAPYFSSQRVILPELVGDDERLVAQANAILDGALRATALVGPATAGLLIAVLDAPNVLYFDAATFLFAFVTLALFVPNRPPQPATEESRGILAGVRFVLRDRLLASLVVTALFGNMFGQMFVLSLPVLAYSEYGGSSRLAGLFFGAYGAGAVVGSLIAIRIMPRFDPVRLAARALIAASLPIWLLALELPAVAVLAVLAVTAIAGPLINAPLIGMITTQTPEALRPKVMTAVMTFAMLAGPIGMLIAGFLLESWGPRHVFLLVAGGQMLAAIPFVSVALRRRDDAPEAATSPL